MLRSDATLQEKSAACRQLARIATKEAVPTLAALLGDEKLSHMARYALETIPDPSVDEALREALGKRPGPAAAGRDRQSGRPARRQGRGALAGLLKEHRRRSGRRPRAGQYRHARSRRSPREALPETSGGNQTAICEGLLRCAEALAADGQADSAQAIYERLRELGGCTAAGPRGGAARRDSRPRQGGRSAAGGSPR